MFDLNVTVTGLCALAPEVAGGASALHVLMPASGGPLGARTAPSSAQLVPLHVPVLSIPAQYLTPVNVILNGDDPRVDYDLRGCYVDLTRVGGVGDKVAIPDGTDVASLSNVTPRTLPRVQVGPDPHPNVTARVSLPPWNDLLVTGGARWNWVDIQDQHMTYEVTFVIRDLPGTSLGWSLAGFYGAPGWVGPALYPHPDSDGRNIVGLEVRHLPLQEGMPTPLKGMKEEHFVAYYALFDPPLAPEPPLPTYESGGMGSLFTCLLSTVGLQ